MGRYHRNSSSNMVRGHGRTFDKYVDGLTTLREGLMAKQQDNARDDMFIDCSPYFSLRGLGLHRDTTPEQRSRYAEKNPRAATDFETLGRAARDRSCGRKGAAEPAHFGPHAGARTTRGAPPVRAGWKPSDGE